MSHHQSTGSAQETFPVKRLGALAAAMEGALRAWFWYKKGERGARGVRRNSHKASRVVVVHHKLRPAPAVCPQMPQPPRQFPAAKL